MNMKMVVCGSGSFAALAQQSGGPTFGSLAQQGTAFGSPQPTGFGSFGASTGTSPLNSL